MRMDAFLPLPSRSIAHSKKSDTNGTILSNNRTVVYSLVYIFNWSVAWVPARTEPLSPIARWKRPAWMNNTSHYSIKNTFCVALDDNFLNLWLEEPIEEEKHLHYQHFLLFSNEKFCIRTWLNMHVWNWLTSNCNLVGITTECANILINPS